MGPAGAIGPKGATGATGAPGPLASLTIVKTSQSVAPGGGFAATLVKCPVGMEATGGGPDLFNVSTMVVTASAPWIDGARTLSASDGLHLPATGWYAAARNNGPDAATYKVAVICAN